MCFVPRVNAEQRPDYAAYFPSLTPHYTQALEAIRQLGV